MASRLARSFVGACTASLLFIVPHDSRADDRQTPPPSRAAAGSLRPHPTLFTVAGGLMIAGYGPVLAAAAPSTVGLLGRLFYFVGTAGIGYLASCWAKTTTYEDPKGGYPESRAPDNYLCSGTHGGALLVLPVAGPIMFIDQHPKDDILNPRGNELSPLARGILYGSAAAQATGLGFLIASLAVGAPPSPQPVAEAAAPDTKPRVHIAPALSPTSAGLTLRISGL